jgi:hypothetical protein
VWQAIREPISRPVWLILLSWGLAVLMISGLLSAWIWTNQRHAEVERNRIQREQDKAMCALIAVFTGGPEPVPGPEGERSRGVVKAMADYQAVLRCQEFESEPPVKPRTRPGG